MKWPNNVWFLKGHYSRSLENHINHSPEKRGSALVSVNEWTNYYSVRTNPVRILGGQEVILKLDPVQHVGSDKFRALDIKHRKCLFRDERQARLKSYSENINFQRI